jgi:hypothetical protein
MLPTKSMRSIVAVALLLTAVACSRSTAPSTEGGDPMTRAAAGSLALPDVASVYEVSYTPETVLLSPQAVQSALRSVSSDGATYTFAPSSADAGKLHVGSIMLLSRVALRRVTRTTQTNDGLVVETEPAAITDAIENGRIQASVPIDFGALQSARNEANDDFWSIISSANAGPITGPGFTASGGTKMSFLIDPFEYTIQFTPVAGQLNIEMTIQDTTTNLSFKATGYLKNFTSLMNVVIANRQVTNMDFSNSGIEGDLTLTWTAASTVAGPMNKIGSWMDTIKKLPKLKDLAFKVPFVIGPVPFTMVFTGGIVFTPAFTSKNTLLKGSLKMHYAGDAGFKVTNGNAQPSGTITSPAQKDPDTMVASLGPLGFTVAVEFPRIELELGLSFATFIPAAYINSVTSFGLVYGGTTSMLPCETHILDVSLNTGISTKSTIWSFFGADTKFKVEQQIYHKNYNAPPPGMPACPT